MIDAHCHLQAEAFVGRVDEILGAAANAGIDKLVVNGTCEADWYKVAELARRHPESILPQFGLHPWFAAGRSSAWQDKLLAHLDAFPGCGVGEIGLDRWIEGHDVADQREVFAWQWKIAVERARPVTVHCLRAWGPLQHALQNLPTHRFLLHSYSGSAEMATELVQRGAYFSLSGYFFLPGKEQKLAVFDSLPRDRLIMESDAPEMRPPPEMDLFPQEPFNHPANVASIYAAAASRWGLDPGDWKTQVARTFAEWMGASPISPPGAG